MIIVREIAGDLKMIRLDFKEDSTKIRREFEDNSKRI